MPATRTDEEEKYGSFPRRPSLLAGRKHPKADAHLAGFGPDGYSGTMHAKSVEIVCPACGREALLRREPVYEGFKKTGETLSCANCGHGFPSEGEVPFKGRAKPQVFTDEDRSREIRLFAQGEVDRLCRHCLHYTVNPFRQFCAYHRKEVEATDTCDHFAPKPAEPPKKPLF